MSERREVVVGLDGSAASDRAFDVAAAQAQVAGLALRAVRAWTTPVWFAGMPGVGYDVLASQAESRQYAQDQLDEQVAKARARWAGSEPVLRAAAVEGPARQVLVSSSQDAALLVLGGHGYSQVKSALLGSATLYALHHASCPVLVVPDEGSPSHVVQRVVVGVDGSPSSRAALHWAYNAARDHQCPLIALHAWLISTLPHRPSKGYVPALREYEAQAQSWLDEELTAALPDRHGVDVRTELSHGSASWALLDKAGPDDLLVVGARGTGGFAELLLGSVASQCAQHARGNVVVVRAGQEQLGA